MSTDNGQVSLEYVEHTQKAERRMRNIFLGSMSLSLLTLVNYPFMIQPGGTLSTVVRVSFPPVMLWSFVLTAYAFYSLWRVAEERREMLERSAITDPKTGVRTLSYIRRLIQKEYEKAIQTRHPTSVIYVDLEGLDAVNQKFGHTFGDIVLRDAAKTIQDGVPEEAVVGHLAGDEFAVVLSGMDLAKAKSVAAVIQQKIADYSLDLGKDRTIDFLRCRIGVVVCPGDATFADEIIGTAQKAAGQTRR